MNVRYLLVPGNRPRIEYRVLTDDGLFRIAREYFGLEGRLTAFREMAPDAPLAIRPRATSGSAAIQTERLSPVGTQGAPP